MWSKYNLEGRSGATEFNSLHWDEIKYAQSQQWTYYEFNYILLHTPKRYFSRVHAI
jgi:hypothetical protein